MTPRTAWRGCAAAGIVAFICSASFGLIPGMVACGPTGGLDPIVAFEFTRTPAAVAALFGSEPCTATLVAAQKTGLLLDTLGFIPSYTAFLILAAIATGTRTPRVRMAVIATFIIAAVSDQIENGLLYAILRDLPGTSALLGPLWWAVHVKFTLLALGMITIGALLFGTGRKLARVFGTIVAIAGCVSCYGVSPASGGAMVIGFLYGWTTLLVGALLACLSTSPFAARAAPPPDQATPSA
ncbi:hypothetical protein NDN01_18830 [Sphingomonas sp. QA11]|uniref:hypothetical protein n=1 Tax=Sphingomonas sp. QA11 TaxID=2950605 RepID=UPI002349A16D|nr:hypothetical protein [Sphingomonas sp. QA11]WCM26050.1 hypothetical protein NDN01_18830 [Sphingomonas sp. QA11]